VLAISVVAMLLLSHGLDTLLQMWGVSDQGTLSLLRRIFEEASPAELAGAVCVVGILAGTAEEVLFRGYMQTRLSAHWGPVAAVVVTSLFFGLVHFDPIQGGAAVILGLYLGAITEWSGSLRPAILCHVLNNGFGTLGPALLGYEASPAIRYASVGVAAAGLVLLLPWLRRRLRGAGLPGDFGAAPRF
jgi:membrane protease YdiL (CAAX protease family)